MNQSKKLRKSTLDLADYEKVYDIRLRKSKKRKNGNKAIKRSSIEIFKKS